MSTDVQSELEPLAAERLASVPGVLGDIARERAQDYEGAQRLLDRSVQPVEGRTTDRRAAFLAALRREGSATSGRGVGGAGHPTPLNVIAEVKRSSPSQGAIAPLEPVDAARRYVRAGAAAISVLTEPRHFHGELEHLAQVAEDRRAWDRYVPLLRKDFTVHPAQLLEARAAGADAVLLIVAVLGEETGRFLLAAHDVGLAALVEVHDEAELDLALAAGAEVIGVNNRDLATLRVDLATAPRLLAKARASGYRGVLVAESGYASRQDLVAVEGFADAVLVGTSLAGSGDLEGALKSLRGA